MPAKALKNGTVLSFDKATDSIKVIPKASILIVDDRITAIESDFNALNLPANTEVVDVSGKIVSPGFINTHLHAWQSVFRSLGPNTNLMEYFGWVCGITPQVPSSFTPADIYISTLQGHLDGLNGGVTTSVDQAHHNWSTDVIRPGYEAAVDSGARVFWCYDVNGRNPKSPVDAQWAELEKIADDLRTRKSTVTLGLGYDGAGGAPEGSSPLSFTQERISKLNMQALTIHYLGGPWPSSGASPAALEKDSLHKLTAPLIFSHAGHLTPEDMSAIRAHDMNVSITPESEFHYGHGQVTGHLIASHASLGIDTNWTFSGDILTQARIWLQSTRNRLYEATLSKGLMPANNPVTAEQAFLLATRQGGKALKRDDLGVLAVGAVADMVVFAGDSPNMLGWSDAVAAVLLHANVGDIKDVMVGGEWRKRDGKLVDGKKRWVEVKEKFLEAAKRLQVAVGEPPAVDGQLWGFTNTGPTEKVKL